MLFTQSIDRTTEMSVLNCDCVHWAINLSLLLDRISGTTYLSIYMILNLFSSCSEE